MAVLDAGVTRANLLSGNHRLLIAPAGTVAIPANIDDIHAMVAPYAKKPSWVELGATTDSTTYEMSLDSEDQFIQQSSAAVASKITEQIRSVSATIGEFTPASIRYSEEGGADFAIAAGANKGAQTRVRSGEISTRAVYRFAIIGERDLSYASGPVTEPGAGALQRGPLFALVGHRAQLAPEDQEIEFDSENLAGREITWNFYPDASIPATGENTVSWFFETPGTIAAV
jgi:hypothetical protein